MKNAKKTGILHFILYNRGHAGMCNVLMSIQNAIIIAKLTNRYEIIFYHDNHIFNSDNSYLIFDLYDIQYNFSIKPLTEYPENITLLPSFAECCFFTGDQPNGFFANGRDAVNLDELRHVAHIGTTEMTLGYYAYQFCLAPALRDAIVECVKESVTPKQKYLDEAVRLQRQFGDYQSVHVRRGDYLKVPGTRNAKVTWEEILPNIAAQLDTAIPVLIHTDEVDEAYFEPMAAAGYTLRFFEKHISTDFDDTEKGLISLLVATFATRFMGTMISTFTGIIHQYRRQHGDYRPFKYLYSQIDTVKVSEGEIQYGSFGRYSWNRLDLSDPFKKTLFFAMEHRECYPDRDFGLETSLRVFPKFLGPDELDYLNGIFETERTDYDPRQRRHRTVRYLDRDDELTGIVSRVTKHFGDPDLEFENGVQFFEQLEGGETFLHSDSLYAGKQTERLASILFYLGDDYDGGYMDFPYLGARISPSKGTMVFFPIIDRYGEQLQDFSHSAGVVTKGAKRMCYLSIVSSGTARP